jgi:hypothetical protein
MAETKEYKKNFGLLLLTLFIVVSVVFIYLTAYTKYIFAKDYYFYIEAPCDPDTTKCFIRDCDDYCPPNGLDTYSAYTIKASDFSSCEDNSCSNICNDANLYHICEPIICDAEVGDTCSNTEA